MLFRLTVSSAILMILSVLKGYFEQPVPVAVCEYLPVPAAEESALSIPFRIKLDCLDPVAGPVSNKADMMLFCHRVIHGNV